MVSLSLQIAQAEVEQARASKELDREFGPVQSEGLQSEGQYTLA